MGNQDDKAFLKTFSGIIVGLIIVAVVLIVIAQFSDLGTNPEDNPSRAAISSERTLPVGDVRTEVPAEPEPVPAETEAAQVDPASIDGANVYASACQACHASGAAGAPIPGSEAFAERAAKGVDELTSNAINGINAMPPKGGFTNLSDAEVRAAVEHMLSQ